jgi:hypothetical protein
MMKLFKISLALIIVLTLIVGALPVLFRRSDLGSNSCLLLSSASPHFLPDGTVANQYTLLNVQDGSAFTWNMDSVLQVSDPSPDGRYSVERHVVDGPDRLYLRLGLTNRKLLDSAFNLDFTWAWSPNSTQIAYETLVEKTYQIVLYNTITRSKQIIIEFPSNGYVDPFYLFWSFDGRYLVVYREEEGEFILWSLAAQQIISRVEPVNAPTWSPTSDTLVYATDNWTNQPHYGIIYADQHATEVKIALPSPMANSPDLYISGGNWSPDGQYLWVLNFDTTSVQRFAVISLQKSISSWIEGTPYRWLADKDVLLFTQQEGDEAHVMAYRVSDGTSTRLLTAHAEGLAITYEPESNKDLLAVAWNEKASSQPEHHIFLMNTAGDRLMEFQISGAAPHLHWVGDYLMVQSETPSQPLSKLLWVNAHDGILHTLEDYSPEYAWGQDQENPVSGGRVLFFKPTAQANRGAPYLLSIASGTVRPVNTPDVVLDGHTFPVAYWSPDSTTFVLEHRLFNVDGKFMRDLSDLPPVMDWTPCF